MGLMDNYFDKAVDALAEGVAKRIETESFDKNCLPVITFDACTKWASDMKKEYPQADGFLVSVKENPDPRNENDKICVVIAICDAQHKAISPDGEKAISTVMHGKTIDEKFLDTLNGRQAMVCKFTN